MNRKEWCNLSHQEKLDLRLFHYKNECSKHFKKVIEKMKKERPGVKIIIHHLIDENSAMFNENNYELWDINYTVPMFADYHSKLHSSVRLHKARRKASCSRKEKYQSLETKAKASASLISKPHNES